MKWWEMFPYFKAAVQNNYIIKILEPNTPWRISVGKLAQRNKHNVDQESIARMLSNYEPGTVEDILRAMQYQNYAMIPHIRSFPDIQPQQGPSQQAADSNFSRFTPKEQRSRKYEMNREHFDHRTNTNDTNLSQLERFTEEWPAFEKEQTTFWKNDLDSKLKVDKNLPKPPRKPTGKIREDYGYFFMDYV